MELSSAKVKTPTSGVCGVCVRSNITSTIGKLVVISYVRCARGDTIELSLERRGKVLLGQSTITYRVSCIRGNIPSTVSKLVVVGWDRRLIS